MRYSILFVLIVSSGWSIAHDCLPEEYKGKIDRLKASVVTGKGETYVEAEMNLHKKLPQFGVLQKVNLETTRLKTSDKFMEVNKIKNKVKANFDFVSKYECKHQGEYYITSVIPKSGVDYLPKMPKGMKKDIVESKNIALSLQELGSHCKDGDLINVIFVHPITKGLTVKAANQVVRWDLDNGGYLYSGCGRTDISYEYKMCSANCKWKRDTLSLWEKPFSVTYFGPNKAGWGFIEDWTLEFQLQIIADSMGLKSE